MDANQTAARRSEILTAFEGFREELDEHNDRRRFINPQACQISLSNCDPRSGERIIKTNRDITNLSKKLIFQLHRIAQDENTLEGRTKAIAKSASKFADVQGLYAKLQDDVVGEWGWKYARTVYVQLLYDSMGVIE